MKKIILTGGGTAGHVTPNLALVETLKSKNWDIDYIGSVNGIEKQIVTESGLKYHGIKSGKLRRYFSIENFTDPFKVIAGVFEAYSIIRKIKPNIVFSKGGFVTVPVIIGAYLNRVPVIIHESDMTPGLANKISIPMAKKVCVSFPETLQYLNQKGIYTGTPIRSEILKGNKEKGYALCNFNNQKPVLLIIGGSLGSEFINNSMRNILDTILEKFQVIHVCGKGNYKAEFDNKIGYKQFEYVNEELSDIFAITDIIVARAGSNSIFEFLNLRKPNLLIPLSRKASRGDQILNAESFEKMGYSKVIQEEDITPDKLISLINQLYNEKNQYIETMNKSPAKNSVDEIIKVIEDTSL